MNSKEYSTSSYLRKHGKDRAEIDKILERRRNKTHKSEHRESVAVSKFDKGLSWEERLNRSHLRSSFGILKSAGYDVNAYRPMIESRLVTISKRNQKKKHLRNSAAISESTDVGRILYTLALEDIVASIQKTTYAQDANNNWYFGAMAFRQKFENIQHHGAKKFSSHYLKTLYGLLSTGNRVEINPVQGKITIVNGQGFATYISNLHISSYKYVFEQLKKKTQVAKPTTNLGRAKSIQGGFDIMTPLSLALSIFKIKKAEKDFVNHTFNVREAQINGSNGSWGDKDDVEYEWVRFEGIYVPIEQGSFSNFSTWIHAMYHMHVQLFSEVFILEEEFNQSVTVFYNFGTTKEEIAEDVVLFDALMQLGVGCSSNNAGDGPNGRKNRNRALRKKMEDGMAIASSDNGIYSIPDIDKYCAELLDHKNLDLLVVKYHLSVELIQLICNKCGIDVPEHHQPLKDDDFESNSSSVSSGETDNISVLDERSSSEDQTSSSCSTAVFNNVKKICTYIEHNGKTFALGAEYVEITNGIGYGAISGERYKVVQENDFISCVTPIGIGCYQIDKKKSNRIQARSGVQIVHLDTIDLRGFGIDEVVPSQACLYVVSWYNKLLGEFGFGHDFSVPLIKAIRTRLCMISAQGSFPYDFALSTGVFYFHSWILHKKMQETNSCSIPSKLVNKSYLNIDFDTRMKACSLGVSSYGKPMIYKAIECDHQVYETKEIFSITAEGRANVDFDNGIYPHFVDLGHQTKAIGFKEVYFRFMGERDFVVYDVTDNNLSVSLKRCLGCREKDDDGLVPEEPADYESRLWGNQANQCFSSDYTREELRDLRVHRVSEDELIVGNAKHHHSVHKNEFVFTRQENIMLKGRKYLRSLVEPGFFTKFYRSIVAKGKETCDWAYRKAYDSYSWLMEIYESRCLSASIAHTKKQERQRYVTETLVHRRDDLMLREVQGNVKWEYAKPRKAPRLFVSYGAGCMAANELPEFIKTHLDGEHWFPVGSLSSKVSCIINIYAKPNQDKFDLALNNMTLAMDYMNNVYFLIYSDDMCVSGNIDGTRFSFNIDISSNDASNGPAIFGLLRSMYAKYNKDSALALIRQCLMPVYCHSPKNKKDYFKINFDTCYEGSGTVNTTLLNHIGSFMNVCGMLTSIDANWDELITNMSDARALTKTLVDGCELNGHKITIQNCIFGSDGCYEDIQFLKHSPMQTTTGQYVWVRNLGCIFRSLGSTNKGSLRPNQIGVTNDQFLTMDHEQKVSHMMNAQVQSLKNEARNSVIDALVKRFYTHPSKDYYHDDYSKTGNGDRSKFRLDEMSICRRYGLHISELEELADAVSAMRVGTFCHCYALTKIFNKDYDL